MADPLRFHPLVVDDLAAAAGWYDNISSELGNRFRFSVDSRFADSLVQNDFQQNLQKARFICKETESIYVYIGVHTI